MSEMKADEFLKIITKVVMEKNFALSEVSQWRDRKPKNQTNT